MIRTLFTVVFSPDNAMLATGGRGADCRIMVYDVASDCSILHTLEGHTKTIWSLSFSPDSTRLCSGSWDNSIKLWGLKEGSLVASVNNAHTNWINSVAHSPNGKLIASGSRDKTIKIWDAKTLELKHTYDNLHTSTVWDLAFTPHDSFLLSASHDKTIRVTKVKGAYIDEMKEIVLVASRRFRVIVDNAHGTEVEKVEAARLQYPMLFPSMENQTAGDFLKLARGGVRGGVLSHILSFI